MDMPRQATEHRSSRVNQTKGSPLGGLDTLLNVPEHLPAIQSNPDVCLLAVSKPSDFSSSFDGLLLRALSWLGVGIRFSNHGFFPRRKGQLGQSLAEQSKTSLVLPPQQSIQRSLIALRGDLRRWPRAWRSEQVSIICSPWGLSLHGALSGQPGEG